MAVQPKSSGRGRRQFTVDDYHRMAEAGILTENDRVELLDGEIVEMTPIGSAHAGHVNRIASLFRGRLGDEAIISVQNPIRLDARSEPEPDVALLEPRDDFYADAHPGPNETRLVVEVAESSVDFDRSVKVPLYARADIPVVWILDLAEERLEVYEAPSDGKYRTVGEFGPRDTVEIPVDGAVELRCDEIFL